MPINFHFKISSGGFGDVWNATDSLDRKVAVKIIRLASVGISDAIEHAKALARTNHPNVVTVYSVEKVVHPEDDVEVEGIVMELLEGDTLAQRINGAAFAIDELRQIGLGLIDGLAHIHKQGLTHGDLHNENVMIDDVDVKIIDILYLDTLAGLNTQSKDEKFRRDLVSLRLILQDLLFYSDLDQSEITVFNNLLHTTSDIESIREAFTEVANPETASDTLRQLDHAYRRATEESFVEGEDYASALIDETPKDVILPLLKKLVAERGFESKQRAYVRALWSALGEDQIPGLMDVLNSRLEEDTPDGSWSPNLRLVSRLQKQIWHRLSLAVRIRLESMITNDILAGRHDIYGNKSSGGSLGTYAKSLWPVFTDQSRIIDNIESMLRQNWYTQNYIGKNFLEVLPELVATPDERERMLSALAAAVKDDARIVVNRLSKMPEDWGKEVQERVATKR